MSIGHRATAPSSSTSPSATNTATREIAVAVSSLEDLFNAPTVNPFVDRDLRMVGEPALERAVRELQVAGLRDRRPLCLRVQVPANQLTSLIGTAQVRGAIRRYCAAKLMDNDQQIQLTQRRARRGLAIAVALVAFFALLAYLLLVTLLAAAGQIVQTIVVGSLSVFAWVVLWDTLEALIFDPIPADFENRALTQLVHAEVVVDTATPDVQPSERVGES